MRFDHRKYTVTAVLAVLILMLLAGTVMAVPIITNVIPDLDNYGDTRGVGDTVKWTTSAQGAESYAFYIMKRGVGGAAERVGLKWYSGEDFVDYKFKEEGTYFVTAFVKDGEGNWAYQDSMPIWDVEVVGGDVPLSGVEFVEQMTGTKNVGDELVYKVKPEGGEEPFTYAFYLYKGEDRVDLKWYAPGNLDGDDEGYEYTYKAKEPGSYKMLAFIKDGSNKVVSDYSDETKVEGTSEELRIESILGDKDGTDITWAIKAAGGDEPYQYAFYVYKGGDRVYVDWYKGLPPDGDGKVHYVYSPKETGDYSLLVFVKDSTNKVVSQLQDGAVEFKDGVQVLDFDFGADPAGDVGEAKTWTVTATGGDEMYQYAFYVYEDDVRVHTQWYSSEDSVDYVAKIPDVGYYVIAFVKDGSGNSLSKESAKVQFGGTAVSPFCIEAVTLDDYSLTDFDKEWEWTVKIPEPNDGVGPFSYCYYLYKDGTRVDMAWYGEFEETYHREIKEAGEYYVHAFAKDTKNRIVSKESNKQETRLYYFNYTFELIEPYSDEFGNGLELLDNRWDEAQGLVDGDGNKNHGWVFDDGYFHLQHPTYRAMVGDPENVPGENQFDFYGNDTKKWYYHTPNYFPVHDNLSARNYGNQTGKKGEGLDCGSNGVRTYYHAPGDGTLTLGTMNIDGVDPFNESTQISPSNGKGCVWRSIEADNYTVYRFAGLRPAISARPYYPRQEFWQYMITPNLPYGEVKFRNIRSTDGDSSVVQEARFNFEFMHHSTGLGNDPYDQRVGISISQSGQIRVLDSKAGLGAYDEAQGNFYMPLLEGKTAQQYGFDNNNWNTLRIQGRADGKIDLILNGKVVYTTALGYYHITNAERGTITLEVVQAAADHTYTEYAGEVETPTYDSAAVGNAWVQLKDYSFGIMKYTEKTDLPGDWPYE